MSPYYVTKINAGPTFVQNLNVQHAEKNFQKHLMKRSTAILAERIDITDALISMFICKIMKVAMGELSSTQLRNGSRNMSTMGEYF